MNVHINSYSNKLCYAAISSIFITIIKAYTQNRKTFIITIYIYMHPVARNLSSCASSESAIGKNECCSVQKVIIVPFSSGKNREKCTVKAAVVVEIPETV